VERGQLQCFHESEISYHLISRFDLSLTGLDQMKSELKMEFDSRRALKETTSVAATWNVALASSGGWRGGREGEGEKRSENRSG